MCLVVVVVLIYICILTSVKYIEDRYQDIKYLYAKVSSCGMERFFQDVADR